MLHAIDHLIPAILKAKHEEIINNNIILDDIFEWYKIPVVNTLFADSYTFVEEAKSIITQTKIDWIFPYAPKQESDNYILTFCSGSEDEQFLDDYGTQEVEITNKDCQNIDVKSIENNHKILLISRTPVPKNCIIYNKNRESWSAKVIDSVFVNNTYQLLIESIPTLNGTFLLSGYYFKNKGKKFITTYNKSLDRVSATMILSTTGQYMTHYIVSQYVRYLLKSSRKQFEFHGFQNMSFNYSEITASSSSDASAPRKFRTSFFIHGEAHDEWIVSTDTQSMDYCFKVIATRDYTPETYVEEGKL